MLCALGVGLVLAQKSGNTEITVYNQGFALVKEVRSLNLKEGRQVIEVRDVPSSIESTSVGIRSLSNPGGLQVLEQNYQYDVINPTAILAKSVGLPIRFVRSFGDQKDVLNGTLLNAPISVVSDPNGGSSQTYNGMVIKTDDGHIVLNPTGEVEVSTLPGGLISVPTLMWDLNSQAAGDNQIELSYLTQGMNWNADYVLTLGEGGKSDLQGWVTIDNQSGASWEDANLKLLAGEVNRVNPSPAPIAAESVAYDRAAPVAPPQFQEQSLFEYHLYTLQRPATVRNRETKQISLLEGHGVPVTKKLIIDSMLGYNDYYPTEGEVGTGPLHTQVRLEFLNDEKSHLGMPLPKGKIKVYQRDQSGSVQMLGEDQINHTPRNERISLAVGNSFDIVASRKRINFTQVNEREADESFEIEVRNRKKTAETVHVYERKWGDWKITKKNHEFEKLDSNTADFVLKLNPNEVQKVDYTVHTRWW